MLSYSEHFLQLLSRIFLPINCAILLLPYCNAYLDCVVSDRTSTSHSNLCIYGDRDVPWQDVNVAGQKVAALTTLLHPLYELTATPVCTSLAILTSALCFSSSVVSIFFPVLLSSEEKALR